MRLARSFDHHMAIVVGVSDLMKPSTQVSLAVLSAVTLLQLGCDDSLGPLDEGTLADERISITNDEAVLDARVRCLDEHVPYLDEDVPVDQTTDETGQLALARLAQRPARAFSLRLVAEVSPPSIDGQVLQATSIAMRGEGAVVSYAMRGEPYLGAIDVFHTSRRSTPRLRSQTLFRDTDIHAVSLHEDHVYIAEATADPTYPYPAVLEVIRLLDGRLVRDGNDGALSVFDRPTLTMTNSVPLHDARWVDVVDGKVVVVQGTPGRLSFFAEGSLELLGNYPLPDSDVLGLDWSGVVTNAVAVDEDLLFISNGIARVYVAQGSRDFDETGSEEPLQIRLLGRLQFDNLESANHVAYKNHYLVIAPGAGGIKTVEIRVN
jgi:hypothetical protein